MSLDHFTLFYYNVFLQNYFKKTMKLFLCDCKNVIHAYYNKHLHTINKIKSLFCSGLFIIFSLNYSHLHFFSK